jgi:hypothetical protein
MKVLLAIGGLIAALVILAGLGWLFVMWLFGPNDVNKLQ